MSRRSNLMDKPFEFNSLEELIREYENSYVRTNTCLLRFQTGSFCFSQFLINNVMTSSNYIDNERRIASISYSPSILDCLCRVSSVLISQFNGELWRYVYLLVSQHWFPGQFHSIVKKCMSGISYIAKRDISNEEFMAGWFIWILPLKAERSVPLKPSTG